MLEVHDLGIRYGATVAVEGASLRVGESEIVTLVGANGAGKSSLLKGIAGLERAAAGRIVFRDDDVTGQPAHARVGAGMALVPEGRRVFGELTVRENLELGAYLRRGRAAQERAAADLELVQSVFPRLAQRRHQRAGSLSGGEQQMLAIGRAVMAAPRLLILDEPSLGLGPRVQEEIVATLRQLHRERRLAILVAEQNAVLGLDLADRGYVLHRGRVVLEGSSQHLAEQGSLIDLYLGSALGTEAQAPV
jgi:branched-chain amino acid transport system ATP-binding protein